MEPPAKRLKRSLPESQPCHSSGSTPNNHAECANDDAKALADIRRRQRIPTPASIDYDLRRRHIFDGSARQGRAQQLPRRKAGTVVQRAPETTVLATAVDVNVQDGNTTIANTIVIQATDATVISFASIGVMTVPAQATISASITGSISTSDSSQATPSSSSSSSSTSSPSTFPTNSGYNASTTASSDITTTITLTSTLNVSFFNGTVITLSNPSALVSAATITSSDTQSSSLASQKTSTSLFSSSSSLIPTISSVSNGPVVTPASGAAGSGSPTTSAPSSATTSSSGSSSGPGPSTPDVVGGVVGGVAGLAVVLLILLAFLRMYRKRLAARGQLPEQIAAAAAAATGGGTSTTNPMTQRSSHTPLAAALLSSTRRFRPQSSATSVTAVTTSSGPDSERGFQRIAGRKIAPVLGTGSDQYGGNYGAFESAVAGAAAPGGSAASGSRNVSGKSEERGLAESSFYRDSGGFYGGTGGDPPVSPTLVSSSVGQHTRGSTRDFAKTDSIGEDPEEPRVNTGTGKPQGFAVMRPSPARTPVTTSPATSSLRLPIQQGPSMEPGAPPTPALPTLLTPRRQDGVGRSLASQDGSTRSRFTESV